MRSHRLSMSKVDMAIAALDPQPMGCLYGFRGDVLDTPRESGRNARIGTIVHKLAECHVKSKSFEMANVDPTELAEALTLFNGPLKGWLDARDWTGCEWGLRYDAVGDVARTGPVRGEPGYEDVGPMVLPGTLDLVTVDGDEAAVVDLKTGQKTYVHEEQLLAQAVAVSRYYKVNRVRIGFAFVRKTKSPEPEWRMVEEDELDAFAGKIGKALRRLPTSEPVRGDWCFRCDCKDSCPKWQVDAA